MSHLALLKCQGLQSPEALRLQFLHVLLGGKLFEIKLTEPLQLVLLEPVKVLQNEFSVLG